MPDLFQCNTCPSESNIAPVNESDDGSACCSRCGSTNGEVLTPERLTPGLESGAIYSTDARGRRVPYKRPPDE